MGVQGDRIFAAIREVGDSPEPWASFGDRMCWEAAHSAHVKDAIKNAQASGYADVASVDEAFDQKETNLRHTRKILANAIEDYDTGGRWAVLDERAQRLDIDDVSEAWAVAPVEHPFPIARESLRFNWRYMKTHGVRAFYEMTATYIDGLIENTQQWRAAWEREAATGEPERLTTVQCDLVSVEAPMHCDICRKTMAALLYLDG